jgi:hypothetical protein
MLRKPLLAAALVSSVAAAALAPASAQTAASPTNTAVLDRSAQPGSAAMPPRILPGQLVDGRIAFLKAELKITTGQEAQWQKVEAAMHENAEALDRTITATQSRRAVADAVEQLEIRAQFAKVRADNDARLLTAFKPLYASLSPEQQRMATALLTAGHGWHRGWGHRA